MADDTFVCIAPAVSHTESVGDDDAVFAKGCFDNLSNGKVNVSLDSVGNASERSNPPQYLVASGKRQLTIKPGTTLRRPNGSTFSVPAQLTIPASPTPGKDYFVILNNTDFGFVTAKPTDGSAVVVGGYHTLCADAGTGMTYTDKGDTTTLLQHPLNGYIAGDILPHSVWCNNFRPYSDAGGLVFIPTVGIWVGIYLMDTNGKSIYQGVIARSQNISWFTEKLLTHHQILLDDVEFTAAMMGSNEMTSVAGASEAGATTGGAGGRSDTAGRRMLSIYGVEEGCGSVWQFLRDFVRNETLTTWTPQLNKGSWYQSGVLVAGGVWTYGARCGSGSRNPYFARSYADASLGGRGRSRHVAA